MNVGNLMYTTKKTRLKRSFHYTSCITAVFIVGMAFHSGYAQELKPTVSLHREYDNFLSYEMDSVNLKSSLHQGIGSFDTSFLLFSIAKLWHEDTCGHKAYRINISKYISLKVRDHDLFLQKKTLLNYLGKPDMIIDSVSIVDPEDKRVGDKKHKIVFDKFIQTIKYSIVKSENCDYIKEYVVFRIDRNTGMVQNVNFSTDFFDQDR